GKADGCAERGRAYENGDQRDENGGHAWERLRNESLKIYVFVGGADERRTANSQLAAANRLICSRMTGMTVSFVKDRPSGMVADVSSRPGRTGVRRRRIDRR